MFVQHLNVGQLYLRTAHLATSRHPFHESVAERRRRRFERAVELALHRERHSEGYALEPA